MGHKCDYRSTYDFTKIEVAKNLADIIEDTYNPHNGTSDWKMTFGMHWCCFGSKENAESEDNEVLVDDGFIE